MRPLQLQDVIELLRDEIDRVGGQSEWARQTGIERPLINKVLNGRRLPPLHLCRALGLEWVAVRHVALEDDKTRPVVISNRDFLRILWEEIKKAGSIIAWSQQKGVERSHLSSVLHKRRSPDKKILSALNISEVLVRADEPEAAIGNRWRQDSTRGGGKRHAPW